MADDPATPAPFEHAIDFDPAAGVEAIALHVPATWCVYLLTDARGRPVQLLCVRNLRASLRRRLGVLDEAEKTRRADLTQIVRRIRWTRVDSTFEQDWVYLEAARSAFPESYAGVLGFYPAWFVHLNPATRFPRLTRQNRIDKRTGDYLGPFPDKHAADRYIRGVETAFDLCRDWERLTRPDSDPCQWRQMGKCVGPCEGPPGGISLDGYRALMHQVADTLRDLPGVLDDQTARMRAAAEEQAFETAAQIKSFTEELAELSRGSSRFVRPIERFRYLAVTPGGKEAAVKLFAITPGRILPVAVLLEPPTIEMIRPVLRTTVSLLEADDPIRPMDAPPFERLSLATAHLFAPKKQPGEFLHVDELDEETLLAACRRATKPGDAVNPEDEGEIRGLQAV
jgi:DNA polymerase-3 subunit epsilon